MTGARIKRTVLAATVFVLVALHSACSAGVYDEKFERTLKVDGPVRLEVETGSGDNYFPLGSAKMKSATMLALQLIGAELAHIEHPIELEGHTDAAKFGAPGGYGNWELSSERANAARRVLETVGVSKGQIIGVRAYADTKLRVPEDPLASANRRISILLPYSHVNPNDATPEELAVNKRDSLIANIGKPLPQSPTTVSAPPSSVPKPTKP